MLIHDGGFKRQDKKGKVNYNLIPLDCLEKLALHYTKGAEVHGLDNWKKAKNLDTFRESMFRHLIAILNDEKDEDHFSALVWNTFCLEWHENNEE